MLTLDAQSKLRDYSWLARKVATSILLSIVYHSYLKYSEQNNNIAFDAEAEKI